MNAIGIVFLYDRKLGPPKEISVEFKEFFAQVTENLVKEGLLDLPELKNIIDSQKIYWGGIRENFNEIISDTDAIGKLGWITFKNHTDIEARDELKSLIYDESKAPWGFTLIVCVIYG
ncbi:MAG: hypothetical protein ACFFBP_11285 [Promethearchaeota archaeon]